MDASEDTVPWPLTAERAHAWDWSRPFEASGSWSESVLSESMLDELRRLDPDGVGAELTEVVAVCLRDGESALLSIEIDGWVWPITLFPDRGLYRAPIDWSKAPPSGLARARLLSCDPAVLAPPLPVGRRRWTMPPCHYRLEGFIWALALLGPRSSLLAALQGPLRFGLSSRADDTAEWRLSGALGSALARLRDTTATLAEIAGWPGLDAMRAIRLINGLCLSSRLTVIDAQQWRSSQRAAWSDTVSSRWPYRS